MNIFQIFILVAVITTQAQAQESLSLNQFLGLVREKNLDLKIDAAKLDAAKARAIGFQIPPPMVKFNRMKMQMGDSANGIEISQTIPFPTKLAGDSSARKYMAKSQEEIKFAGVNEIMAQAKLLYFTLWASQERLKFLEERRKVLETHVKLSRSTARSDSFIGIHVLKTEADLDFLENDVEAANQTLRENQQLIASFLNEDPSQFLVLAKEPDLSAIPKIASVEKTHQIRSFQFDLESLKAREVEAKSSWLPDFSLSYKEMGATNIIPRNTEVMLGMTLPFVFFWEPYAASKSAVAERTQAQVNLNRQKSHISAEKATLVTRAESLRKQILLLKEKTIPRAEKRVKLVRNVAPRDMESLQDRRETLESLPQLRLKELELRFAYEQTIAGLEKYLVEKGSSDE